MKKILQCLLLVFVLIACGSPLASTNEGWPTDTAAPPTPTTEAVDLSDPETEWVLLLLGGDERDNDPSRRENKTDVIMFVHIFESGGNMRVTYLSIPRDLWIPQYGIANSIYRNQGAENTANILGDLFGLEVDAVIHVKMDDFADFIDDIGGVKVTLPHEVHDKCGSKWYNFAEGQTEVFGGYDLLCLSRMRAYQAEGFFARQRLHPIIVRAIYTKLANEITHDPVGLARAALEHRFVDLWPITDIVRLSKLAIRSTLGEIEHNAVSLERPLVYPDTETGYLADGTIGEFYVHRTNIDLSGWATCAINRCEE